MLFSLLLLLACSGGSPDCGSLTGAPRQLCLTDAAQRVQDEDPAAAESLIRQLDPGPDRDLAWMSFARSTTLPVCGEIGDTVLRESCQSIAGRMHLRADAGHRPEARARGEVVGCPPDGPPRERCIRERALQSTDPKAIQGYCAALTDPHDAQSCSVDAAGLAGESARHQDGVALCTSLDEARWQSECWFRLAESAAQAPIKARAAWCRSSGLYSDQCAVHLLDETARSLTTAHAEGSLEDLVTAASTAWAGLAAAGLDQGQGDDREGLFWVQVLHQAILMAADPSRPAPTLMSWSPALPPTLHPELEDLLLRHWLHRQPGAIAAVLDPQDPLGAILTEFHRIADTGPPAARQPLRNQRVAAPQHRGGHRSTLGKMPWPMARAEGCTVSPDERARIALAWGASSLEDGVAISILDGSASDPSTLVRAFALSAIEERLFEWDRGGELPRDGVAELLARRAGQETVPALRERAILLTESLLTRQPLPPFNDHHLCKPHAPPRSPAPTGGP